MQASPSDAITVAPAYLKSDRHSVPNWAQLQETVFVTAGHVGISIKMCLHSRPLRLEISPKPSDMR